MSTICIHAAAIIVVALLTASVGHGALQPLDPRMVAIGDIHGDVDNFLSVLRHAQLVDCDGNWIGGTTIAVQMGDVCDRGPHSHSLLEYIHDALIPQASAAGGEFIQLMGNHELLSMRGDHRFTLESLLTGAFGGIDHWEAEFSPPRSLLDAASFDAASASNASFIPFVHPALRRARRLIQRPPRTGTYGHVISKLPVLVSRYGTVFVHAGILPVHAQLGIKEINRRMYYDVLLPHLWEGPVRKTASRAHTLSAPSDVEREFFELLTGKESPSAEAARGPIDMGKMVVAPLQAAEAFFEINSPVWTREQVYGAMRQQKCQLVGDALAVLSRTEELLHSSRSEMAPEGAFPDVNPRADGWSSARLDGKRRTRPLPIGRLVVGHTIQPNGAISVFCGGRFLATDISMSQYMQGGGHLGYVEFRRETGVTANPTKEGGYEQENAEVQAVEQLILAEKSDHKVHIVGVPTYPAIPWLRHPPHTAASPPLWSVAGHKRAVEELKKEREAELQRLQGELRTHDSSPQPPSQQKPHMTSLNDHALAASGMLGVALVGVLVGAYFLLRRSKGAGRTRPSQRPNTAKVPIPY